MFKIHKNITVSHDSYFQNNIDFHILKKHDGSPRGYKNDFFNNSLQMVVHVTNNLLYYPRSIQHTRSQCELLVRAFEASAYGSDSILGTSLKK